MTFSEVKSINNNKLYYLITLLWQTLSDLQFHLSADCGE